MAKYVDETVFKDSPVNYPHAKLLYNYRKVNHIMM